MITKVLPSTPRVKIKPKTIKVMKFSMPMPKRGFPSTSGSPDRLNSPRGVSAAARDRLRGAAAGSPGSILPLRAGQTSRHLGPRRSRGSRPTSSGRRGGKGGSAAALCAARAAGSGAGAAAPPPSAAALRPPRTRARGHRPRRRGGAPAAPAPPAEPPRLCAASGD